MVGQKILLRKYLVYFIFKVGQNIASDGIIRQSLEMYDEYKQVNDPSSAHKSDQTGSDDNSTRQNWSEYDRTEQRE